MRPRARHRQQPRGSDAALTAIKLVHTLAWFSIESCVVYLLYAGFTRRSDRRTAIAAEIVAAETLIFGANGCRCPLTQLAERRGAKRGSVTDIYLPRWFAHNLPAIHVPIIVLAAYLHARNLQAPNHACRRSSNPTQVAATGPQPEPNRGARAVRREA